MLKCKIKLSKNIVIQRLLNLSFFSLEDDCEPIFVYKTGRHRVLFQVKENGLSETYLVLKLKYLLQLSCVAFFLYIVPFLELFYGQIPDIKLLVFPIIMYFILLFCFILIDLFILSMVKIMILNIDKKN